MLKLRGNPATCNTFRWLLSKLYRRIILVLMFLCFSILLLTTKSSERKIQEKRSPIDLYTNDERVTLKSVAIKSDTQVVELDCKCETIVQLGNEFKRLLDLKNPNPFLDGSSNYEVLSKRHPNIGSVHLSSKTRCNKIPFISR